jgi:hypothetical protein
MNRRYCSRVHQLHIGEGDTSTTRMNCRTQVSGSATLGGIYFEASLDERASG